MTIKKLSDLFIKYDDLDNGSWGLTDEKIEAIIWNTENETGIVVSGKVFEVVWDNYKKSDKYEF